MGAKVRYRKDKRAWYLLIDHNGKRFAKAFGSDEKAARDAAKEAAKALKLDSLSRELPQLGAFRELTAKHEATKAPAVTLEQFGLDVIKKLTTVTDATREHYQSYASRFIYPVIGTREIGAVSREDVATVIREARTTVIRGSKTTLKHGSVQYVVAVLSVILSAAVDRQQLARNPAQRVSKLNPVYGEESSEVQALSADGSRELLEAIREAHGEQLYTLFLTLARTGLRIGEGMALKWGDIDFARKRLVVRRTLNTSTGVISVPKGKRSRHVDLSAQLVKALQQLRKRAAIIDPEAFLFPSPTGGHYKYHWLHRRVWRPATEAAKLGAVTPHVLRHSFASQLLNAGKSIMYVSEVLGHATVTITLEVYAHFIPSLHGQAVVNSLDDAAQPSRNPDAVAKEAANV